MVLDVLSKHTGGKGVSGVSLNVNIGRLEKKKKIKKKKKRKKKIRKKKMNIKINKTRTTKFTSGIKYELTLTSVPSKATTPQYCTLALDICIRSLATNFNYQ